MFDVRGQFVAKRMGPEGRLSELRYDNATKAEGTRYQVSIFTYTYATNTYACVYISDVLHSIMLDILRVCS